MSRVEVVGHGGAGDFFPGNSRMSLEKALELGVDRIEIDVQVASGDQLVLVHDDEVLIEGRKVRLRKLTVEQIRGALDGLLTLDEAIEMTRGRCALMIDMKSSGYEMLVAEAIVRHEIAAETIVSSTFALSLRSVREFAPGVSIGLFDRAHFNRHAQECAGLRHQWCPGGDHPIPDHPDRQDDQGRSPDAQLPDLLGTVCAGCAPIWTFGLRVDG